MTDQDKEHTTERIRDVAQREGVEFRKVQAGINRHGIQINERMRALEARLRLLQPSAIDEVLRRWEAGLP